jgi:hypothetical protein
MLPKKSINSQGISTAADSESVGEPVAESVAESRISTGRIAASVCASQCVSEARVVVGAAESGLGMSTGLITF